MLTIQDCDETMRQQAAQLKEFASLLCTHHHYHEHQNNDDDDDDQHQSQQQLPVTDPECIKLQEKGLTRLFSQRQDENNNSDNQQQERPCCILPGLRLHGNNKLPRNSSSGGENTANTVQQCLAESVDIAASDVCDTPNRLLDAAVSAFCALVTSKNALQCCMSESEEQLTAAVTVVQTLEYCDHCEDQDPYDIVVPIILQLVMDWKKDDDVTMTVRVEGPGVLQGRFHQSSSEGIAAGGTTKQQQFLQEVYMELDTTALLQSMVQQATALSDYMSKASQKSSSSSSLIVAAANNNNGNRNNHSSPFAAAVSVSSGASVNSCSTTPASIMPPPPPRQTFFSSPTSSNTATSSSSSANKKMRQ